MSDRAGQTMHRLVLLVVLCVLGGIAAAGLGLPLIGLGVVARDAANSFNSLPSDLVVPPLEQRSVLRAADGSVLAVLRGPQNRVSVPITAIPVAMQQAIVAIEDSRFYLNHGVDPRGIVRAAFRNSAAGSITQGGSTLTQQYVKNVLVQKEGASAATADTLARKLQEARYAVALSRRLSKAQILDDYLNIAYFGEGAYGVGAASEHYFGEHVQALTLPQAALLAGLVEDPALYDPEVHPAHGTARRNTVLARMAQLGYLDPTAANAAEHTPLGLHVQTHAADPCEGSAAPFYCSYVVQTLLADPALGATPAARQRTLFEGGLNITTTLDQPVENDAQQAVNNTVPITSTAAAPIAMVRPGTGAVLALTVNRTYGHSAGQTVFPLATTPYAQPGSSFKLFTLIAALEAGIPTSQTYFAPTCYHSSVPGFGNPTTSVCKNAYQNATPSDTGTYDMTKATWFSINTYFIQLEQQVGLAPIKAVAEKLGVPAATLKNVNGSLTLGGLSYGVSPLVMANAYAAIAAHGLYCPPKLITSITDARGHQMPLPSDGCRQVVPAGIADTITGMLQGVISHGTGYPNAVLGRPAAGKTGTVGGFTAAWFVGYTPDVAAAVAVADPRSPYQHPLINFCVPARCYRGVYGADLPALAWGRAMRAALANTPPHAFTAPPVPVTSTPSPTTSASASPSATVPSVLGQPVSQATATLQQQGFAASVAGAVSAAGIPAGDVAGQSPAPSALAAPGSTVVLTLSNGSGGPQPPNAPSTPSAAATPAPGGNPPPAGASASPAVATRHPRPGRRH